MTFSSTVVSIDDLYLDDQNPRFIVQPNPDQKSLMEYLIAYEEVLNLALGISLNQGLVPGDRIIVTVENGKYIVLEGNRRTCACKILLNNSLVPKSSSISLPEIDEITRRNILTLNVDVVNNRNEVQSTLYHRHIDGVKDWLPVSKMRFCTVEFDNGMDVPSIAKLMSTKPDKVISEIKNYRLTSYIFNLNEWLSNSVLKPDIFKYKYTLVTHALDMNTKVNNESGYKLLKMSYNGKYDPISDLSVEVFNHALFLLAKAAYYDKEFNTRSLIEDVPGLIDYLRSKGVLSTVSDDNSASGGTSGGANGGTSGGASSGASGGANGGTSGGASSGASGGANGGTSGGASGGANGGTSGKPPLFFENLTWTALNASNPEHIGLIALANELRELSKRNHYGFYPIATAMLLRSLFEQLLKYYIKKKAEWGNLTTYINKNSKNPKSTGYDPMMNELVSFLISNNNYKVIFPDRTMQSAYTVATARSMLDFFDTNIHNTHIIHATKTELEGKIASGLGSLISFILNDTK